ncbi:MAG: hypothetical protein O7G85_11705 [Planctomycetota bacterium]|nr:hypothetical protein [Planctomycetota bacterium]
MAQTGCRSMILKWRNSCRCRGGATTGLLTMLASFGALGAAAVFVGPRVIQAGSSEVSEIITARSPMHQKQFELLTTLIARSQALLMVHDRGTRPYEEMLLWMEDRQSPGTMETSELALISHSRILQTITLYRFDAENGNTPEIGLNWQDPKFCDAWRSNPDVVATSIVGGISDLELLYDPLIQGGSPALRITFTWASDTADGSDKASTLVEVNIPKTGREGDS